MNYQHFLERAERRYWRRMLRKYDTITAVARVAGVLRSTVYRRLKTLGVLSNRQNLGNEQWQALSSDFITRRLGVHLTSEANDGTRRL